MNKRYIWSALMIAAIAVACDSNTDDPEPTVPVPTPTVPVPTPTDSIPGTPVPTDSVPTTPELKLEVLTPDTTVSADEAQFMVAVSAFGVVPEVNSDVDWMSAVSVPYTDEAMKEGETPIICFEVTVEANDSIDERVGKLIFSAEGVESVEFTVTQQGAEPVVPVPTPIPADDSITSSIGSMTGVDFVLGPIPMEVKGTLTYSVTCNARNYTQGTLTISKSDLCSTLGITTADFDARKGNTIVCVPMNKDWSEGENTAGGSYGAWFGSSGTIGWGSSSIAYLEGNDMISFGYGMHPDNKSNSCVCRLQYQDKENETACNVEVTVSLKQ